MFTLKSPAAHAAALATVLVSLAIAHSAYAAPIDTSRTPGPPSSEVILDSSANVIQDRPDTTSGRAAVNDQQIGGSKVTEGRTYKGHHKHGMRRTPEQRRQHVENRIKTLHERLQITQDQEAEWNDVAQAMRDNEANISQLIEQRRREAKNMNAIEDLESYQKIAQAHADGLRRVSAEFETLYEQMTPQQKENADNVFGKFQGMGGHHHVKWQKDKKANTTQQRKAVPNTPNSGADANEGGY